MLHYSFVWLDAKSLPRQTMIMVKGDTSELIYEELDRLFGEGNYTVFQALALHSLPPVGDLQMDRIYTFFNENFELPDSQGALISTLLHTAMNMGYVVANKCGAKAPTVPRFPSGLGHEPPKSGGGSSSN